MDRDELVELATDALLKDRKDNYVSQTVAQMYENAIAVVDVIEPLIRADERAKHGSAFNAHIDKVSGMVRADLRARVVALRDQVIVVHSEERPSASEGALGAYDQVLALIDGSGGAV